MLAKGNIEFDWFGETETIEGWYSDNKHSAPGGWAAPYLDFETSVRMAARQNVFRVTEPRCLDMDKILYKRSSDTFYVNSPLYDEPGDESTMIPGIDIDGKHVYDWGVLDWTWEWE